MALSCLPRQLHTSSPLSFNFAEFLSFFSFPSLAQFRDEDIEDGKIWSLLQTVVALEGCPDATSPYLSLSFPYLWGMVSIPPVPRAFLGNVCLSLIYLFSKYLLSPSRVPGPMLGTGQSPHLSFPV